MVASYFVIVGVLTTVSGSSTDLVSSGAGSVVFSTTILFEVLLLFFILPSGCVGATGSSISLFCSSLVTTVFSAFSCVISILELSDGSLAARAGVKLVAISISDNNIIEIFFPIINSFLFLFGLGCNG